MRIVKNTEELRSLIGEELGVSEWIESVIGLQPVQLIFYGVDHFGVSMTYLT